MDSVIPYIWCSVICLLLLLCGLYDLHRVGNAISVIPNCLMYTYRVVSARPVSYLQSTPLPYKYNAINVGVRWNFVFTISTSLKFTMPKESIVWLGW